MPTVSTISSTRLARPIVIVAIAGGVMLGIAATLWAYYGTAVFYEMILAGIAACF